MQAYPEHAERVPIADGALDADLIVPPGASATVVFAHGSGSGRRSPRNREVASSLNARGFATVLVDLLTAEEARRDTRTAEHRFDVELLGARVQAVVEWLGRPVGLFGASTGAAAALVAAAGRDDVTAIVSRGGRPDLARDALPAVRAPTLLIVGANDPQVLALNQQAQQQLQAPSRLEIVPGAGHLFEEPGAMDEVSRLAGDWFAAR